MFFLQIQTVFNRVYILKELLSLKSFVFNTFMKPEGLHDFHFRNRETYTPNFLSFYKPSLLFYKSV